MGQKDKDDNLTPEMMSLDQTTRYFRAGYIPGLYERIEENMKPVWESTNSQQMGATDKVGMLWVAIEHDPGLEDSVCFSILNMRLPREPVLESAIVADKDKIYTTEDLSEAERRESRLVMSLIKKYTEVGVLENYYQRLGGDKEAGKYKAARDELFTLMDNAGMADEALCIDMLIKRLDASEI